MVDSSAVFSPCRTWRYVLVRCWDAARPLVNLIGLNPSTADELRDDPTIRRCLGYARSWGYGGVRVTNLFALRSTDPRGLRIPADPFGPENRRWVRETAELTIGTGGLVVCAWGAHGALHGAQGLGLELLDGLPLQCLGLTRGGYPKHPLYLRKDIQPRLWRPE